MEQKIEDVGVGFLDLVEEQHAVRAFPDRLGEKATLFAVDVARRRAHESLRHVLLHELAHVEASHGLLVVEKKLGQRLGELGLPDATGAKEQERPNRFARVSKADAPAPNRA